MGLLSGLFGPPTKTDFAKAVLSTLRKIGDARTGKFDEPQFRILFQTDGESPDILNLQNLYDEYCRVDKKERRDWLQRTCIGLANRMEMPEDFEDVKPDILPSVRTRSFSEIVQRDAALGGGKFPELAMLPLSEHLIVCLVYDLPQSMQFVNVEHLEKWGVTAYETFELARQNLEEKTSGYMSLGDKLYIFESGDAYDGTRLILIDKIRALSVQGNHIGLPMTRGCLLITGSEDVDGLGMMLKIAEEKLSDPRPLCSAPVELVGDDWKMWLPPADHPHFGKFRKLQLQFFGSEYAEQKELLEKTHERDSIDVFVATFSGQELTDGRVYSFCTWTNGVPTWLPQTDQIAFIDMESKISWFVPWKNAVAVIGDVMTPLDCYPPRWSVNSFPSPDELDRMNGERRPLKS